MTWVIIWIAVVVALLILGEKTTPRASKPTPKPRPKRRRYLPGLPWMSTKAYDVFTKRRE